MRMDGWMDGWSPLLSFFLFCWGVCCYDDGRAGWRVNGQCRMRREGKKERREEGEKRREEKGRDR